MSLGTANEVFCSCGDIIFEVDSIYCSSCGDIACKCCYTDCLTCGKMFCSNCSANSLVCLKCNANRQSKQQSKVVDEKAFLVIDNGVAIPIKNSWFMIQKTSILNSRDIKLNLNGRTYRFCYRSMVGNQDNTNLFDYFLFFEEIKASYFEEFEKQVDELFEGYDSDYEDYSTLDWGWRHG